jgi:addiction module HigA family antidote
MTDDATILPAGTRNRAPTHPGEVMQEILEETMGLSIEDAARRLGVNSAVLEAVLGGRADVYAELALRFQKLTGAEPSLYLAMQVEVDLWRARQHLALSGALERIEPIAVTTER